MTTGRRVVLLLTCVLAGTAVGLLVQTAAGSPLGWLALPVLLALAWWRVADPARCADGTRTSADR